MLSSWWQSAQEVITSAQDSAAKASEEFFALPADAAGDQDRRRGPQVGAGAQDTDLLEPPRPALERTGGTLTAAQWEAVCNALLHDQNVFVIPPARILEHRAELLKRLGLWDAAGQPPPAVSEEQQLRLIALPHVAAIHYVNMPRYVGDTAFWSNLAWRLAVLRQCAPRHAAEAYKALTAEPALGEPRGREMGTDNAPIIAQLTEALEAAAERDAWLAEKTRAVDDVLRNAGSGLQLLEAFVHKEEKNELSASVVESCRYHKTKITAILGDLVAQEDRLRGTALAPENGDQHAELLATNERIHKALDGYAKIPEANSRVSDGSTSSPVIVSPVRNPDASPTGAEFTAQLPWDDDDDD